MTDEHREQLSEVFRIISEYSSCCSIKEEALSLMDLSKDDPMVRELLGEYNLTIESRSRGNLEFTKEEMHSLVNLYQESGNKFARFRINAMLQPLYQKYYRPSYAYEYEEFFNTCYLITEQCLMTYRVGNAAFTSYLCQRLNGAVQEVVPNQMHMDSMSRFINKLKKIIDEYEKQNNGSYPSDEYLQEAMGCKSISTVRNYKDMLNMSFCSINCGASSESDTISEESLDNALYKAGHKNISSEEAYLEEYLKEEVKRAVEVLPEDYYKVVSYKFGLGDCDELSTDEILDTLGISKTEYKKKLKSALMVLETSLKPYSSVGV